MMTDLITLRETSAEDIRLLLDTAQSFKEILERPVKKVPTLRGRQVVTLFYEASTRTRVSFENAAKIMSADTTSVAAATSSVQKGESLLDTVQTLRAMRIDCLVMRHPQSGRRIWWRRHWTFRWSTRATACMNTRRRRCWIC